MAVQTESPYFTSAKPQSSELSLAEVQFCERLQAFAGNGVSDLDQSVLAAKRTEESIRAVLRNPELRTAMILDPEGIIGSYAILHSIPSRVITVGVRPNWEQYASLGRSDLITVNSSALSGESTDHTSAFDGQIDILFRYHQGTSDSRNLQEADKLLSRHGHYVEFFVPADGSPDRVVTYISRQEMTSLLS